MDNLSIRYVFDRKKIATNNKQGLLQIEVRINKSSIKKFISTGIKLYKNQVSPKNGFTCINHPNAQIITGKARNIYNKIEAFAYSKECNSLADMEFWDKSRSATLLLRDFIYEELRKIDASDGIIQQYNSLVVRLDEFGKIKTFADITLNNILELDIFLRKYLNAATRYKRHIALKRMITSAHRQNLCKDNPYDTFKPEKGHSRLPVFLTEDEVQKIIDWQPTNDKIEKVKDLFIFQAFTGLAFIDLSHFNRDYISEVSGKKVILSNRQKTEQCYVTLLLPIAESILKKYNYLLPKISNQKYNDYLKLIAAGVGINKNITSHTARHTFATFLINKGVPIESVSKALGHANIGMTEHYAKLLGKKVVDDMSRLLL